MNRLAFPPVLLLFLLLLLPRPTAAEQYQSFGDIKVHYVVVNSTYLQADIAATYHIVRARDRALVNISLIGAKGESLRADLEGSATNLLGQQQGLEFRLVEEGSALYYIATLRYSDRDTLRYSIDIIHKGSRLGRLEFQQQMYLEEN